MRITKLVHSCLLVEMPAPVNRTALFDPGVYSLVDVESLKWLDDIIITHHHADHMNPALISQLQGKFPEVRITAPSDALAELEQAGVANVSTQPPEGVRFFDSPHEVIKPYGNTDPPEQIGIHYLDMLSHPGDSHSFKETMPILALPVTGPWGSTVSAVSVALELKPRYVIPIHDWFWHEQAQQSIYERLEKMFAEQGIIFIKAKNGESFTIKL